VTVDAPDTIAAIATASGVGGVGIVRISGPAAIEIAAQVIGRTAAALDDRVRLAWARDRAGARIDQVLAFAMRAPRSFTGEHVAELHGHGGSANLTRLLDAVLARGARVAEPGEFTRRAVEHGKLDLVRAEALLAVIQAGSERALRAAHTQLAGALGDAVAAIERRLIIVLAEIEGRIDFPEDDLERPDELALTAELRELAAAVGGLAASYRHGRAVTEGVSVALVGAVNVGKSSLLNALVGRERALVADAPGTTRDFLEARTAWDGVEVTLIDTAGLRSAGDPIEARGIALGEQRAATADVVIVVNDSAELWNDGRAYGARAVVVSSKADRLGVVRAGALATSAHTGQGLDVLRAQVLALAGVADREGSEAALVTTARQAATAGAAARALGAALATREARGEHEVIALELRTARQQLAVLRGAELADEVLDEVFARFCIGK